MHGPQRRAAAGEALPQLQHYALLVLNLTGAELPPGRLEFFSAGLLHVPPQHSQVKAV